MAGRSQLIRKRDAELLDWWKRYMPERIVALDKAAAELPVYMDTMGQLANGIRIMDSDGIIYTKPPDFRALDFLITRVLGRPVVQRDELHDNFTRMQTVYVEGQVTVLAAQVRALQARAAKDEMDVKLWPKQFVTEEEELANLQTLAAKMNEVVMNMTPEDFQKIKDIPDASEALEELKSMIGDRQASAIASVLEGRSAATDDEDEEEDA